MKSKTTLKLIQKEKSQTVEIDIPEDEIGEVTAGLLKNNHLRGLYTDYCILNQEFLKYVVSCKLTGIEGRMLFFLMSQMDKENKVLLNNKLLQKELKATEKTIINSINKLIDYKVILKQKIDVSKYEYELNYDILNPQLAFKNKASFENVKKHKSLIEQESPYIKQYNIEGNIELINSSTGEIFHNQKK